MRWPGRAATLALAALLLSGCEPAGDAGNPPPAADVAQIPIGQGFDFYVLSLSWSPSYCEAEGDDANPQQCKAARPYAFVVHGLWPQFERGFPEDCQTDEPKVSNETLRTLYDLMPSAGLIRHEWTSHGACTGLSQRDYFTVLRAAREKVAIPAAIPADRQLPDRRAARRRSRLPASQPADARPTASPSPATSASCARCASA